MSFMRSDAQATLLRWRDAMISCGVLTLGLWWVFRTYGLLNWVGYAVSLIGAVMLLASLQRLRFRTGLNGPGVVRIDEGAIAYFGPLTGGAVALSELNSLALDHTAKPAHWRLSQQGLDDVYIPLSAEGADTLFDVFASLPGIRTEWMLAQMKRHAEQEIVIWQRDDTFTNLRKLT